MKAKVLFFSFALFTTAAQAKTVTYVGEVVERLQCMDSGGVFASDTSCNKLPFTQKACKVTLDMEGRRIDRVVVEVPEIKIQKESWFRTMSGSAKGPWYFDHKMNIYSIKLNRSSSLELKFSTDQGILQNANVYTDHRTRGNKIAYKQYSCKGLKLSRP